MRTRRGNQDKDSEKVAIHVRYRAGIRKSKSERLNGKGSKTKHERKRIKLSIPVKTHNLSIDVNVIPDAQY